MKRPWTVLAAAGAWLAVIGSNAPGVLADQQPGVPEVVTVGQGVIRRAPDRAFVTVTVESRARSPREAQRLNADLMTAVRQKLGGVGMTTDDLRTVGYLVEAEYDYTNNKRVLRGYVARNTIEVRVDELDRVGEVLDVAVEAGGTSVGGVRFDLKDRRAVEREALREAVADARARAEAAAAGAGRTIERILRIQEEGAAAVSPPRSGEMLFRAAAAPAAETPISAGEIEIRVSVTLTAALK